MNAAEIEQFLRCLGAREFHQTDGWLHTNCPLAPWTHTKGTDANPSFAVALQEGESYFNCFSCHRGSLDYLVSLLRSLGAKPPKYELGKAMDVLLRGASDETSFDIKEYGEEQKGPETIPWDEDWLASFMRATSVKRAMEYLESRGVPLFGLSGSTFDMTPREMLWRSRSETSTGR